MDKKQTRKSRADLHIVSMNQVLWDAFQGMARDHGMNTSEFLRLIILSKPKLKIKLHMGKIGSAFTS